MRVKTGSPEQHPGSSAPGTSFTEPGEADIIDADASPSSYIPGIQTSGKVISGAPGQTRPRRSRRLALLVCLALLAIPAAFLVLPLIVPDATAYLHPRAMERTATIAITAVSGGRAAANQSRARLLTATLEDPAAPFRATGVSRIPAERASGTLSFYNEAPYAQSIPSGRVFPVGNGVQIVNEQSVWLPAGNPPALGTASVPAQAVQPGSLGNIAAGTLNGVCGVCGVSGVAVKNTQDFGGGQDAQTYTVVQQQDIDGAATPLVATLTLKARARLRQGLQPTERMLEVTRQCAARVEGTPAAGSRATAGQVRVSATCTAVAYDQVAAAHTASALFISGKGRQFGDRYRLRLPVSTAISSAEVADRQHGTVTVRVRVTGRWVYQISRGDLLRLAQRLEGQWPQQAQDLLTSAPGVQAASIDAPGGGWLPLPGDPHRIRLVVSPP